MKGGDIAFGAFIGGALAFMLFITFYAFMWSSYRDGMRDGRAEARQQCQWEQALSDARRTQ